MRGSNSSLPGLAETLTYSVGLPILYECASVLVKIEPSPLRINSIDDPILTAIRDERMGFQKRGNDLIGCVLD